MHGEGRRGRGRDHQGMPDAYARTQRFASGPAKRAGETLRPGRCPRGLTWRNMWGLLCCDLPRGPTTSWAGELHINVSGAPSHTVGATISEPQQNINVLEIWPARAAPDSPDVNQTEVQRATIGQKLVTCRLQVAAQGGGRRCPRRSSVSGRAGSGGDRSAGARKLAPVRAGPGGAKARQSRPFSRRGR
jgi:hypothetical protein